MIGRGNLQHSKSGFTRTGCKDRTVAVILAGGEGRRLLPLTLRRAKPAVPFAGCCRLIDFTVSNCINSGLSRIVVITQYRAESVVNHLRPLAGSLKNAGMELQIVYPPGNTAWQCSRGTAGAVFFLWTSKGRFTILKRNRTHRELSLETLQGPALLWEYTFLIVTHS